MPPVPALRERCQGSLTSIPILTKRFLYEEGTIYRSRMHSAYNYATVFRILYTENVHSVGAIDRIRHYKSFCPEGLVPNRPSSWNDSLVALPEGSRPHVGANEHSQSAAENAHGPQRHRVNSTRDTYEPCQNTTNPRPMKDDSLNTNGCPETGAEALHFTPFM
jgi:hypothetical protein